MPKKSVNKRQRQINNLRGIVNLVKQVKSKKSKKTKKSMNRGLRLSPCAAQYALAIANPWDPRAQGACIPKWPARPSQKVTTFSRIPVSTGTNGVGFCLISPTTANDATLAWFTQSNFGGTNALFNANGSGTTTTQGVSSTTAGNAPFQWANFVAPADYNGVGVKCRMVSVGASIQYTGTVSNMGGTYYLYASGSHSNCRGMAPSDVGQKVDGVVGRISNKKAWISSNCVSAHETDYESDSSGIDPSGNLYAMLQAFPYSDGQWFDSASSSAAYKNGSAPIILMWTSTPGNTFEVEIVQHIEYTGGASQALQTASHADTTGFEIVNSAAQTLQTEARDLYGSLKTALYREINNVASSITGGAVRAGLKAATGLMVGRSSSMNHNPYLTF